VLAVEDTFDLEPSISAPSTCLRSSSAAARVIQAVQVQQVEGIKPETVNAAGRQIRLDGAEVGDAELARHHDLAVQYRLIGCQ
jgi:hypothetical protein